MIDNTLAAARAAGGARIVLPGTVYNYDPVQTPVIDENTPQNARTTKGRIRVALERKLAEAAPEVSSLILRAGDFSGRERGPAGSRKRWCNLDNRCASLPAWPRVYPMPMPICLILLRPSPALWQSPNDCAPMRRCSSPAIGIQPVRRCAMRSAGPWARMFRNAPSRGG